jgi:hypothetical protein
MLPIAHGLQTGCRLLPLIRIMVLTNQQQPKHHHILSIRPPNVTVCDGGWNNMTYSPQALRRSAPASYSSQPNHNALLMTVWRQCGATKLDTRTLWAVRSTAQHDA